MMEIKNVPVSFPLMNTDSIIDLIERTLDPMYVEIQRLEKQLPLTVSAI